MLILLYKADAEFITTYTAPAAVYSSFMVILKYILINTYQAHFLKI